MRVLAIDPGTRNTGVVCIEDGKVIYAECISFKESIKDNQEALLKRTVSICLNLWRLCHSLKPDETVIEGFVNFGTRQNVYVSQTPFLVGAICYMLYFEYGMPTIQLSRTVLNKPKNLDKKDYPPMVTEALGNIKNSKETCTNEHLRSALAHGYYYLKGQENERS